MMATKPVLSGASSAVEMRSRRGGEVVAEGTPEQVAEEPRSYTGAYLKDLLAKSQRAELPVTPTRKRRGSSASMREREAAE